MHQYPFDSTSAHSGTTHATVSVPDHEKSALPIIILLHGTGGNPDHMAKPASSPGFNHDRKAPVADRDEGAHPLPPAIPIGVFHSFDIDPLIAVRSWQDALNEFGFRTVNYGQSASTERITAQDLEQLTTLMRDLLADPRHAGRDFAMIAHSRGGILARAAVVDALHNHTFNLQRIRQIITLHSPHQGSSLANGAVDVATLSRELEALLSLLNSALTPTAELLLQWIQDQFGVQAYHDFEVGSPFLIQLAASEPVPGIQYFTFGGTSACYFRLRCWSYSPVSTLPLPALPPFHWTSEPTFQGIITPSFDVRLMPYLALLGIPPILPLPAELTHGIGDGLVTDAAARLPFAAHQSNPLNHAEALWDRGLQAQVAWILDPVHGPTNTSEPPECEAIRDTAAGLRSELADLKDALNHAASSDKPALTRQIRQTQAALDELRRRAARLGCRSPI